MVSSLAEGSTPSTRALALQGKTACVAHGVRAIEDPALVQMLADRQIPLGVCPTSNLVLGVYPSIEAHPLERLRQGCVRVSDDPALLGASLVGEYALCR